MAVVRVRIGAYLDPGATAVFAPLIAAAAKARAAIAAEGRKGAEEFIGGYRTSARSAAAALSSVQKSEEAVTAAAEKSADKQIAAAKRVAREKQKAHETAWNFTKKQLEEELKMNQARTRSIISGTASGVATLARMGAGVVGAAARGMGVNLDVGSVVGKVTSAQKTAVDISNAAYMEGEKGPAGQRQDPAAIIAEARAVADATAGDTNEALAGLQKFVAKTSDLATGRAILGDMARLAKVTSSSLDDMVDAAGDVSKQLGNVPGNAEKTKAIMTVIAAQGKLGSVEIKDLATQMAKVASSSGFVAGGQDKAIIEMGILAQTARGTGGAASANQAATSVASFASDIMSKPGQKALAGKVNIWADDKHTQMRPMQDIMKSMLTYTGGSMDKIAALLPGKQSGRAFRGVAKIYNDAERQEKGSGLDAVDKEFKRLGTTLSKDEITRSLAAAMGTTESKVQVFNNALERVAEDSLPKLVPALEKLAPVVVSLASAMGDIVGFAAENPAKAVVAAIGASFAKQMAAAGLQSAFMSATGSVTQLGLAAGAAGAALTVAYLITEKMNKEKEKGEEKTGNEIADRSKLINKAAKEVREKGSLSPETAAALATARGEIDADKARGGHAELGGRERMGEWVRGEKSLSEISGENEAKARRPQLDQQAAAIKEIMAKAGLSDPAKLRAALEGATLNVKVVGGGMPGAGPAGTTGPTAPR